MNQIEIWFSILARKLLKRGSFISKEDLKGRLLAFVEYFNETMAKPFKILSSKRGFPEQRRSQNFAGARGDGQDAVFHIPLRCTASPTPLREIGSVEENDRV